VKFQTAISDMPHIDRCRALTPARFVILSAAGRPIGRSALRRTRSTLVRAIKNDMPLGSVPNNVAELYVMPGELAGPSESRSLTHGELDRCAQPRTARPAS
jgi:hypothetical protein